MKKLVSAIPIVLLALSVSALAAEPVVIGAYLPMTGNVASYGQLAWRGISVAKKMEPQVLGRPVEVRLVDTKSDKMESANAVFRLIEKDRVAAIIGEMISGNTIAGSEIAERHKIPMVSPTATNPIVTQGKKYIFRVCFVDEDQGRVAAQLAADNLKAKTAALIYDISQDYCVTLAAFFRKQFTDRGGRIVAETKFRSGDREFDPQLKAIMAAKPDVIYAPIYYAELALIARQARAMKLNVPIVAADGAQAPELITLGGDAVEGVYFTAHFHPDMVSTKRGKDFLQAMGRDGNVYSAIAADAYFIVLDAIRRAQSTDSIKIRDALASTRDFEGVTGKIALKPDGNAVKAMVVNKVQGGTFVYVTVIHPQRERSAR